MLTNFVTLMCIFGTFLSGIDWDIRLWSELVEISLLPFLVLILRILGHFVRLLLPTTAVFPPRCTKISIPKKTTPYVLYIYDYCSCSTLCLVGKWVRSLFDVVYLFTSRSTVVFKSINSSTFDLRHAILIYFRIVLAKENSHFSFQWNKIKVC